MVVSELSPLQHDGRIIKHSKQSSDDIDLPAFLEFYTDSDFDCK